MDVCGPVTIAGTQELCTRHQHQDPQHSQITPGGCEAQVRGIHCGELGTDGGDSAEVPRTACQVRRVKEPHGKIQLGKKEGDAGPQPQ